MDTGSQVFPLGLVPWGYKCFLKPGNSADDHRIYEMTLAEKQIAGHRPRD